MAKVLIIGCGYVGSKLGLLLKDDNQVFGLRTNPSVLPSEIKPLAVDLISGEGQNNIPNDFDFAIYAISARERTEKAYRAAYVDALSSALKILERQAIPLKRMIFVSSTGVYGENSAGHVTEDTPADATHFTGKIVREGECLLEGSGIQCLVARLGGIYGPGRERILRLTFSKDEALLRRANVYTNRIHLEDAAAALAHLLFLDNAPELVNVVDSNPALQLDVLRWITEQSGSSWPALARLLRPTTFEGKRISNQLLVSSGYDFIYPTFKEGYRGLIPR